MLKFLQRNILGIVVLPLCLSLSALLVINEKHQSRRQLLATFYSRLHETTNMIEQSLRANEKIIRGVQGLFSGSATVDSIEFRSYIESLKLGVDFSGLRGIGFALIKSTPNSQKIRAPLIVIEPESQANLAEIGQDLFEKPAFQGAMEQSRDTGNPAISSKITLSMQAGYLGYAGFALFIPIFTPGQTPHNQIERRARSLGWIYAPFLISDLMASLYGQTTQEIRLRLYDGLEISARSQLYDSHPSGNSLSTNIIATTEYLDFSGHTWTMIAQSLPEFDERYSKDSSVIIGGAGSIFSLSLTILIWLTANGRSRAMTIAHSMTRELREAKEHFELIFHTNPDTTVISRVSDGKILNVNESFTHLFGYSVAETIGINIMDLKLWVKKEDRITLLKKLRTTGHCIDLETQLRRKNGATFHATLSARITSIQGVPHIISVTRDISERKVNEEIIRHMAQHDPLTDLPNRALFTDRLLQALARSKREKTRLAVIFIDLDRFKPVNDNFGHQTGDILLREVARRITSCLRESDSVGRIGGDEFVVLMAPVTSLPEVQTVSDKLRSYLEEPYDIVPEQEIRITCSSGFALYPEDGMDEEQLIKMADYAMYQDKSRRPDTPPVR